MRLILRLLPLALLLLPTLASSPAAGQAGAPRPNILFILADDLGYGDLGCFGQKRIRTPHLDRVAREGMKMTSFYAGSTVCAPSRCVLMTGLHTGHCTIRGNSKANLRPEDVTVAEILQGAGYDTALFGKWGLGHEGSMGVPTRQGFNQFFGYLDQSHAHNYYPSFLISGENRTPLPNEVPNEGNAGQGVASRKIAYSHDLIANAAVSYLEKVNSPFFLYLALTTPHANNEAKQAGMETPGYDEYAELDWPEAQKGHAAMISRMDRDIGRIFYTLRSRGLDRNTLVLFSSDNGPHREGGNDPDFNDSNGPFRGIKRDFYDGGVRVPTIAWWPGRIAPGSSSDHIGYFADFMPAAAELAGVEAPTARDGISFVPELLGRKAEQKKHDHLYWEFYERGSSQAVRLGRWKGIAQPFGGPLELYDLRDDPGEQTDVAARNPAVVKRIEGIMAREHVPDPQWKLPPNARLRPLPR